MAIATIGQALQAYASAGKPAAGGIEPRATGGTGFADLLRSAAGDTVASLKQGEAASLAAVSGKANLTEVVTAVSNAEATLQTVVAVRDRVIQAYQDILRMPI